MRLFKGSYTTSTCSLERGLEKMSSSSTHRAVYVEGSRSSHKELCGPCHDQGSRTTSTSSLEGRLEKKSSVVLPTELPRTNEPATFTVR